MAAAVNPRYFVENPTCLKGKKATWRVVSDAKIWTIKLIYTDKDGITSEYGMDVGFPELKAVRGVKPVDKGSYTKYEINAALPLADANEETLFFYNEFVPAFNERVKELIAEQGADIYGVVKNKSKERETYMTYIEKDYYATFFIPQDKTTGKEREGADPLVKLNLRDFEKFKTAFCDLSGKPLTDATGKRLQFSEVLSNLDGQGFDFVPRVNFGQIDIGGTSIRAHNSIKSLLLTDIYPATVGGADMSEEAGTYLAKYGDRKDALTEKFRTIQKTVSTQPKPQAVTEQTSQMGRYAALTEAGEEEPAPSATVKAPAPSAAASQVETEAPPEEGWELQAAKPKATGGFNKYRARK